MQLKAFFLGGYEVFLDNTPITDLLPQKAKALLCFLMLNPDRAHHRDRLADFLWPESPRSSARYNLRFVLWKLQKTLKETGMQSETCFLLPKKNLCRFNIESDFWVDVFELEKLFKKSLDNSLTPGQKISLLQKAEKLYSGDFLEGIYFKASPEFGDWIFYERERLQKIYFNLMLTLSEIFSSQNAYDGAVACIKNLLKINPLYEELYYRLIKLKYLSGDRAGAIAEYRNCCRVLRNELNLSPMTKIRRLYAEITGMNPTAAPPALNRPPENKPAVSAPEFRVNRLSFTIYEKSDHEPNPAFSAAFKTAEVIKVPMGPGRLINGEGMALVFREVYRRLKKYVTATPAPVEQVISQVLPEKAASAGAFPVGLKTVHIFYGCGLMLKELSRAKPVVIQLPDLNNADSEFISFLSYLGRNFPDCRATIYGISPRETRPPFIQEFIKHVNAFL